MSGYRILIVEDFEESAKSLQTLFEEEFEASRIDVALCVDEGVQFIEKAEKDRRSYDLAIVDFVLPLKKTSDNPEERIERFDETICVELQKRMPETEIIHMTGHAAEDVIKAHFRTICEPKERMPETEITHMTGHAADDAIRAHFLPFERQGTKTHSGYFFNKTEGYTFEILKLSKKLLNGRTIREMLDGLAQEAGLSYGAGRGELTSRLRDLKLEILARWDDLDDATRTMVDKYFIIIPGKDGTAEEVHLK